MESTVDPAQIAWDERGLAPCVVQDWRTGEVLTLAYMNADSLARTLESGEAWFWSRSRAELWHKGATSGHTLAVRALRYDCDSDALLALVEPAGPACHTGERTCFHNGDVDAPAPHEALPALERTISKRAAAGDAAASYVEKLLAGEVLTTDDGLVGLPPRQPRMADRNAAERAVDLALARLGGDRDATEVPLPRFDKVTPAPPVKDLANATLAILTEGALVPDDNPGGLESARATKWLRYSLAGREELTPGEWRSVHGGFSTVHANADPHRILPLDVARQLEREGAIGHLHEEYLVTAGNGTSVANARRFGVEWAADLRHSGARAAILTAT